MKRLMPLIMAAVLMICMSVPMTVVATNGGDAHSSSMSVEADGRTVEEVQATEGEAVDEVVDEAMDEEELQDQVDEPDGEELAEEAEEASDSMFSTMSDNLIYIAVGLGVLALIIVIICNVKRL